MTDRHAIGGNQPPPVEAFSLHIEELFSLVSGSVAAPVQTDEQEAALDALLDDVRKAKKDADAERAAEKKPHDDAAKAVQTAWKPLLDRCDKAAEAIKAALTPYRTAKQRAKDEAARIAREEAEAKQRAAQEALRQSDDLEARFAAEEQLKQAEKLAAQANRIDRSATGLRTYQVADVTDRRALLEHVMRNDPDALTEWLAEYARKALPAQLPGVTIRIEKKAA
ncbi:MAG: hypothetical protein KG075_17185 [Alphaproteobacteria bacterium]|nr:hypothetical protein [Alphaproteobacteria bacterium]